MITIIMMIFLQRCSMIRYNIRLFSQHLYSIITLAKVYGFSVSNHKL